MTNFYIADQHFFHENVLAFDNSPFSSIKEHDDSMIKAHNVAVNIDDDVYMLGDISMGNVTKTIDILGKLNGNKHLIVGNHDKKFLKNKQFRDCFLEIADYKELDLGNGKQLVLSHYPIPCFNGQFRGNYMFYGHVHNSAQWHMIERFKRVQEDARGDGMCQMVNVGAMMPYIGYYPRTFEEIVKGYNKFIDELW